MAANEYKVKVGVEFNAQMSNINSQIDQLKDKITKLGSATGGKSLAAGLNKDIQEITTRLNGLRDMTITPANFNRFQAELQTVNGLIQKVQSSLNNIDVSNILQKIEEQKSKQTELNQEIEVQNKLIDDLNNTDNRTDEQNKQLDEAIQKRKQLTQQVNGHKGAQTKLEKQLAATGLTQEEITRLLEAYGRAMQEAEKDGQKFKQGQEELANSKLADTIQRQVNAYIGLGAIYRYTKSYIQDLVRTYKEFDQSLVAIAAVTGQTRDQMWANIGVYNKMAQSLGVTTQEVINASKLYYQQGLTTTSVLKLTEETVKLATIAELDSADATEYLTTAMNGFKLSAEESTRVTDVWANLAAKTASDVDELAIAISKVASLAENAGMEIETASAFLNQMIETTREAPENLGTALKTIIARFQELKTSEEELSDGVDANKVERALKSAGVALRDASGQFRDFDDVILELSSKWDGLDRNTQRYIATIAAGSRQQSRFIALVSDYEGLLRNVNYAYDSLGSADAQMAVFQEGLAASTNRLQAAWEGLYTSWSESATVISKLIDGMADFVSTLADLGAGWSALIALSGLFVAKILLTAATTEIRTGATKAETKALKENTLAELENALAKKAGEGASEKIVAALIAEIAKTKAEIVASEQSTTAALKRAAAQSLVTLKYVALAAVLALVAYGIIKLINYEKEHIKHLNQEATAARQAAAQTKDQASNLGVLADELDRVHNAGENEYETRQKILDQFGPTIKNVDVLTGSYNALVDALHETQKEQNALASAQYLDSFFKEQEKAVAEAKASVKELIEYDSDTLGSGPMDTYEAPVARITGYEYKGQVYDSRAEAIAAAEADAKSELDSGRAAFIADSLIDAEGLKSDIVDINSLIQNLIQNSGDNIQNYFSGVVKGENGVITSITGFNQEFVNQITQLIPQLEQSGFAEQFNALFNGTLDGLSFSMMDQLISQLKAGGASEELISYFQGMVTNLQTTIRDGFLSTDVGFWENTIRSNLLPGAQQAFLNTFNSLKDDPAAKQAYVDSVIGLIHSMNPEDITGAMIESLGDLDLATQAFSSMLDGLGNLKDESLRPYFEQLRDAIGETNAAFEEGKATVDAYYDSMASLADLQKGGMSNEDYLAKLYDEAAALAEVTDSTYEEIVAEMLKATTLDDSGQMILQQTDLLAELADMQYNSSATTVEAKRAELLAYADAMDVYADELEAIAAEAEGKVIAAQTGVDSGNVTIEAGMHVVEAQNKMGEAAQKAWEKVEGSKNVSAYNAVVASTNAITAKLKTVNSKDEILALANEARSKAIAARAQAAQLSINKLANSFNKAGKSAGSAAKGTDKLKDALKDLKEQLDEAKKSAEAYMDAVIDKLEGERDAIEDAIEAEQDKLEKERDLLKIQLEAWRNYIQERNDQAQNELQLQADAADMYFNQEIAAIQAKIDALDDEAEAEDRILKLQKARDEYNKAQNSRTRLVLTKGAGWLFKTDQNEIANAQKTLRDVQREIQKAEYQDQVNQLQDQAAAWQEIADKIGESAAEAEKLAAALEQFRGAVESGDAYGDVNAFSQAVDNQQHLNDETTRLLEEAERWIEQAGWEYQDYLDDQARQGFLQEFQDGVVGEAQLQENVTQYLENLLTNQAFVEAQQAILDKIQKVIDFYNEQKALLGLTDAELKAAEEMRDAIEKSYDPTAENLGLGEDSKYFNANLLGLIEQIKKLAEQQAALEAQQKAAGAAGGGSGGGGSSGGGGGTSSLGGTPYPSGGGTPYVAPLAGNQIISGKILQDSIQYGTYDSLARGALNSIRDSYAGNATVYSPGNKSINASSNVVINNMVVKANDMDEFTKNLKEKGLIKSTGYGKH